ncbi:hypothetical protein [Kineococcus rubinsiae]|uniref:hypothetical protein n=1 Tax=Kineococcus rubinsiae TaxID=2609562 RepID=UPI00142F9C0A|nr:hypothetical protein [Kineococcus rubinsiae]
MNGRSIVRAAALAAVVTLLPTAAAHAASPVPSATTAPTPTTTIVPATSTDLPKGHANYTTQGSGQAVAPASLAQAAAASWVCTVYASDPRKAGIFIDGDGSQFCSGAGYAPQRFTVSVQRSRWYGWQGMHSQSSSWSSSSFSELYGVGYDCSGDGTYTYRIVTTGKAAGGTSTGSVQSLNYLRVSC